MRSKSKEEIVAAQEKVYGRYNLHPQYGTKIVPLSPKAAFASGQFTRVPVLQGTNADEGRFFVPNQVSVPLGGESQSIAAGGPVDYHLLYPTTTCGTANAPAPCSYSQALSKFQSAFNSYIFVTSPPNADLKGYGDRLAAIYPKTDFPNRYQHGAPNASQALARIYTDSMFACPVRRMNLDLAKSVAVFQYELDDPDSPFLNGAPVPATVIQAPNDVFGFEGGNAHLAELSFIFEVPVPLTDAERALATTFRQYFTNFATNGDPNVPASHASPPQARFQPFPAVQKLQPGAVRPFQSFDQDHLCSSVWDPFWATGVMPANTL